jgi:hypothetical protein
MSLEASIATLTQQTGLLLDLPQDVADAAQTQIGLIGTEYTNRLATLIRTVHVNQATGLDTNPGTQALPLKTIGKAVDGTPYGGFVTVILAADYTIGLLGEDLTIRGRHVRLQSDGAVKRRVNFTNYLQVISGSTYRMLRGFNMDHVSSLMFFGLTVPVPDMNAAPGGSAANAAAILNSGSCLIRPADGISHVLCSVSLHSCDVEVTATPYAPITGFAAASLNYQENNVTVTGGGALNGRRLLNASNTGGTATSTLPFLITNLTTV